MSNNTTAPVVNVYADAISENRWMANAQLTADDMGPTAWKQYRTLMDNIAIASWHSLIKQKSTTIEDIVAKSLGGLFAFFGSDAKPTPDIQRQFLVACVNVKKKQSEQMKEARKALRKAKVELSEAEEVGQPKNVLDALEAKVESAQAEVERLEALPGHVWYDKEPMLDNTRKHANAKCRKLIEDTMADIIATRALMTVEEKQAEALRLKDERKGRKMREKQEAKATTTAESK